MTTVDLLAAARQTLTDAQAAHAAVVAHLIHIRPEASVRSGWYLASCDRDSWYTTGTEDVCEQAGHDHVTSQHPGLVRMAGEAIRLATSHLRAAVDKIDAS